MLPLLLTPQQVAHFWGRVQQGSADECWPWQGAKQHRGHGHLRVGGGRIEKAHRVAYFLTYGEPKHFVCHRCNNPPCCNPKHLYDGTPQQNAADSIAAGTFVYAAKLGEENPNVRFTVEQILEIRRLYKTGQYKQSEIATMFGTKQGAISDIIRRRTWRQV